MIQVLDKYGNTNNDEGRVLVFDKDGNIKRVSGGGSGTVTSVSVTNGTGISASVANPTSTPNITITNTAPDQTVVLTNGTGISVTGTYPSFTITNTSPSSGGTVTGVTATPPLFSSGGLTPDITIQQASGSQDGYLSSGDWTTFNNKQNALTNPVTGTGTNNELAYFNTTGSTISSLTTATYPSLTELSYVKGTTSAIQTQLAAKQATITGAATTITSSDLTVSRALISNASGKVDISATTSTELGYVSGVTSGIQTQLGAKQDLSLSAYTVRANNTNATANATDQTFKDFTTATYSGSATWTGTTPPSGAFTHTFRWTQLGKLVTVNVQLIYATTGSALTAVVMDLPSACPTPLTPTGISGNSRILYYGSGNFTGNGLIGATASRAGLTINATSTGYSLQIISGSGSPNSASITVQYYTA